VNTIASSAGNSVNVTWNTPFASGTLAKVCGDTGIAVPPD
jgi:hypothetical protein